MGKNMETLWKTGGDTFHCIELCNKSIINAYDDGDIFIVHILYICVYPYMKYMGYGRNLDGNKRL